MLDLITIADRSVKLVSNGSFRDIRLFVAVYEERSFTAAAAREHATQSGVSQHVRKLEDSLRRPPVLARQGPGNADARGRLLYQRCIEMLRTARAGQARGAELRRRAAKGSSSSA